SHEKEPQIFDAITFGSVLENVIINDQTRIADYNDTTLTENTREHLLPKQLQEHGLRKGNLQVRDEALLEIIRYYTREAGVRTL
ncbi:phosphoenolpyruvate carboxykinase (ATP), partial [Bacillus cereus]